MYEVFHPAVIILNVGCLYYFQGATETKHFTEQDTQSQSVAFNSWIMTTGIIIFSKYRHNNVQVHKYNHVGTQIQLRGVGGLTQNQH